MQNFWAVIGSSLRGIVDFPITRYPEMDRGHDKTLFVSFKIIEGGDRNEFWVRCLRTRPAAVNGSRMDV